MKRSLIAAALVITLAGACAADPAVVTRGLNITGFMLFPVNANQCGPVKISFTLTNQTDYTYFSQRPFSGEGYNLYQSFGNRGFQPLPDRYMVGVSLNGGADGYPYRWGFRGALLPGRTTTVQGWLTLLEVGSYHLTGVLLQGGIPVGRTYDLGPISVGACEYVPPPPPVRPFRGRPIYPMVNGRRYPPVIPYMVNGYNYVPARNFLFTIGGNVYIEGPSILITVPGYQLVTVPGLDYGYLNGLPIQLSMPIYIFNGTAYLAPRAFMPIFGGSTYWDPDDRNMYVNSPWQ